MKDFEHGLETHFDKAPAVKAPAQAQGLTDAQPEAASIAHLQKINRKNGHVNSVNWAESHDRTTPQLSD